MSCACVLNQAFSGVVLGLVFFGILSFYSWRPGLAGFGVLGGRSGRDVCGGQGCDFALIYFEEGRVLEEGGIEACEVGGGD
jgi:hypothetical protein